MESTENLPVQVEEIGIVNVDRALEDWEAYQKLTKELLDESDYQTFTDRKGNPHSFKKKSAWRKYMRAFNISTRIVDKEIIKSERGIVQEASFTVRAWTPDGRENEGWGNCSKWEKNKTYDKPNHDIPSTAMTRAINRAISDLIGAGEVSAEEMEAEILGDKPKPASSAQNGNKPKSTGKKPKSAISDEETTNDVIDADFQVKPKTTTKSDEISTEAQVDDEPETIDFKALSKKSKAFKKVCDVINKGGFDLDEHTIWIEAGSMNTNGKLTDKELDEVEVLLGRKPA